MARYKLEGRVVAITGSTGGLGSELAKALLVKGAKLALLDLEGAAAEAQARALGGPREARGFAADVTSQPAVSKAMDDAARHFGGLDVVVANAGIAAVESIVSAEPGRFERVTDINLNGVWRAFRAGLPHVQARRGYLLATSSMAAFVHSPMQSAYCASKAGVWALCDCIRLELRHLGVGVGSVHPTFFPTPMMAGVHRDPVGSRLWGGNKGGVWEMIPLETVVRAVVSGIERRRDIIVVPRRLGVIARAPGLLRGIVERVGFKERDIAEMVALEAKERAGEP